MVDMSLSRLDSSIFRGSEAAQGASSYIIINPTNSPLHLAFGGAIATSDGIGAQVSAKLALERFGEAISTMPAHFDTPMAKLEEAFRITNASVYTFGHQLAAGGRMGASLVALYLSSREVVVSRVGRGSAYLYRGGQLFPFFDDQEFTEDKMQAIGHHSAVDVELASAPIEPDDYLCVFHSRLTSKQETMLISSVEDFDLEDRKDPLSAAREISLRIFDSPEAVPFSMVTHVGPEVIYLGPELVQEESVRV